MTDTLTGTKCESQDVCVFQYVDPSYFFSRGVAVYFVKKILRYLQYVLIKFCRIYKRNENFQTITLHYDRAFIFSQGQKKKKRAREAFPACASITGVALAAALVAAPF